MDSQAFSGNTGSFPAAYKSNWAPLCKEFASEAKIYGEWPPDGVLVLLKLIFCLALFCLLTRADISWEDQPRPGKMVGPKAP